MKWNRREIMNLKRLTFKILYAFSVIILLIVILFPFYWLVNTSFKFGNEINQAPPTYFPQRFTLENYVNVFKIVPFGVYFINSLVVAILTVALTLLFCSTAAYAMNRFKNKLVAAIAFIFLVFSMFPSSSFVIPIFVTLKNMNLLNTNAGLAITYLTFAIPSSLWLLYIYFQSVPRTLEEAAMIDGLSRLGTLFKIVLPLSAPGLATTGILTFVRSWNEFFYALVLCTDRMSRTIPVGINDFKMEYRLNWDLMATASVISVIPVSIMVLIFQKRIISGLTAGAVKG